MIIQAKIALTNVYTVPYPLLKMSLADLPRSAYDGGTAILPVNIKSHIQCTDSHIKKQQQILAIWIQGGIQTDIFKLTKAKV